jgi:Zn-dependent protease
MFTDDAGFSRFDLRFNLPGIHIRVRPVFWLTALILGGSMKRPELLVLWVLIVLIAVLIHELGHALLMRMSGSDSIVVLGAFGGVTYPVTNVHHTLKNNLVVSAAGPAAGLIAGAIVAALATALGGHVDASFGWMGLPSVYVLFPPATGVYLVFAVNAFLFASIYWSLFNLLPVFPLDGGHIARTILGIRPSLIISLVLAISIAVWGFFNDRLYVGILFGLMAWSNIQAMQLSREEK